MRCRPSKRLSRNITVGLAAVLGLSLLCSRPAPAQQGHHQERMPNVMEYLDRLDRPGRDQDQKPAQVVETLAVKPGMHVADLGAGSGYFTRRFVEAVGETGKDTRGMAISRPTWRCASSLRAVIAGGRSPRASAASSTRRAAS